MRFSAPTPELPVRDVRAAQAHYRDRLGFDIAWYNDEGCIGAVSRDDWVVFLRGTNGPIVPQVCWLFVEDVDAAADDLASRGADIVDPVSDKPWGLRQFTVSDLAGHLFHVFCDL
nr:VOC family protein [Thalassococcus arenae]